VHADARREWNELAAARHRWAPVRERWLEQVTERLLDAAGIATNDAVLDVAAGDGGQTLPAARRVGPAGSVLATDIAPDLLAFTAHDARGAGLRNVTTHVADAQRLDLPPGSFDAAISRLGVMLFADPGEALRRIRAALRPGGRIALVVYSLPEHNGFFAEPLAIARRHARLPPPAPGTPGPFSLAAPGAVEQKLRSAGFHEPQTERIAAPLRLKDARECLRLQRETFGFLRHILAPLDAAARDLAWEDIGRALERFERRGGFVAECEFLLAVARR
jgi:ubiquinone/menaquinone biosynthesis C-methylase UbiE